MAVPEGSHGAVGGGTVLPCSVRALQEVLWVWVSEASISEGQHTKCMQMLCYGISLTGPAGYGFWWLVRVTSSPRGALAAVGVVARRAAAQRAHRCSPRAT